jgi:hypothetical protein
MRDAVDATGREIEQLSDEDAARLGYVSLLKDRHSRGLLDDEYLLCAAAARNGDLEMLKALRADDCPWDARTCTYAAAGGHPVVSRKHRGTTTTASCASGRARTRRRAATSKTLKWAREKGCPWDCHRTCAYRGVRRRPRDAEVGAARTTARGTSGLARTRREAATSRC